MITPAEELNAKWLNKFKPQMLFWYADNKQLAEFRKLLTARGSNLGYTEVVGSVLKANTRLASIITAVYLGKNLPEYPDTDDSLEFETMALLLDMIDSDLNTDELIDSLGSKLEFRNDLNVILSILSFSSYALIRDILEPS